MPLAEWYGIQAYSGQMTSHRPTATSLAAFVATVDLDGLRYLIHRIRLFDNARLLSGAPSHLVAQCRVGSDARAVGSVFA